MPLCHHNIFENLGQNLTLLPLTIIVKISLILSTWDVPYCTLLLGEGTFFDTYCNVLTGLISPIGSYLYFPYHVLWSWIVCATVIDALRSDPLMTTLVLPLLCLVCLSMTNNIVIMRGTSTLQITSLVMITLIFLLVLDPVRSCTDKTHCPLCSVTVGDKLCSWIHQLLKLRVSGNRQITWIKLCYKLTSCS